MIFWCRHEWIIEKEFDINDLTKSGKVVGYGHIARCKKCAKLKVHKVMIL